MKDIQNIIWDWNGTLLDDAWLCRDVMNGMLRLRDMDFLSAERYREIFDFPIVRYYERIGFDLERESFEDERVAAFLNEHFVSIKVDREERPDVDSIYMDAVQLMTGQGGWPMSVFLTPDLEPFYAGTYFPPEDKYGRPGFPTVLEKLVVDLYQTEKMLRS